MSPPESFPELASRFLHWSSLVLRLECVKRRGTVVLSAADLKLKRHQPKLPGDPHQVVPIDRIQRVLDYLVRRACRPLRRTS